MLVKDEYVIPYNTRALNSMDRNRPKSWRFLPPLKAKKISHDLKYNFQDSIYCSWALFFQISMGFNKTYIKAKFAEKLIQNI